MRTLWHRMMRGVDQPPEIQGLQRQQFWVLGALSAGPRRMSDLANCAQTSQASLTGIVDRLEEHGLVERTRSKDDRRVVDVALTEEGTRISRAADAAFTTRLEHIVAPLEPAERTEFLRLMRKLTSPTLG
ncbi:MAG TPA: MarR family transcriptional regulator [Coriobacteriia bacterium]|nr:MarR family transcriptional regulator [Coriobacteriia bacterium]